MRLIDADALITKYKGNILTAQTDYAEGVRDVIKDIKGAPTINPKRGGLTEHTLGYECSVCHEFFDDEITFFTALNFCPNCGADMREREGE